MYRWYAELHQCPSVLIRASSMPAAVAVVAALILKLWPEKGVGSTLMRERVVRISETNTCFVSGRPSEKRKRGPQKNGSWSWAPGLPLDGDIAQQCHDGAQVHFGPAHNYVKPLPE